MAKIDAHLVLGICDAAKMLHTASPETMLGCTTARMHTEGCMRVCAEAACHPEDVKFTGTLTRTCTLTLTPTRVA